MADEERKKRPDYRPIIEHDGVLWHRGDNQDENKNKSREELLVEERDYKRRRMSYRGKKMKRSTTQVMRDIIDEYMEEIKHANIANQPRVDATNVASKPSSMIDATKVIGKNQFLISVEDEKMISKKEVTNTQMMHNVKNIIMMIGIEVLAAHVILGNDVGVCG